MPIERHLPEYFRSFSMELDVIKNRVRSIIGSTHWVSDGSHKEAILMEMIRKFLPSKYEMSSGFIIDDDGLTSSRQIDILIYENTSPVFFRSTNFVIIPRSFVRGIIEVKTDIYKTKAREDALENLYSAQLIVGKNQKSVYTGIFAYDYKEIEIKEVSKVAHFLYNKISEFYQSRVFGNQQEFLRKYTLTSFCINQHLYGLHWNGPRDAKAKFGLYHTQDNSFNFFMSNLLNTLNEERDIGQLWYPTEKESYRLLKRSLL